MALNTWKCNHLMPPHFKGLISVDFTMRFVSADDIVRLSWHAKDTKLADDNDAAALIAVGPKYLIIRKKNWLTSASSQNVSIMSLFSTKSNARSASSAADFVVENWDVLHRPKKNRPYIARPISMWHDRFYRTTKIGRRNGPILSLVCRLDNSEMRVKWQEATLLKKRPHRRVWFLLAEWALLFYSLDTWKCTGRKKIACRLMYCNAVSIWDICESCQNVWTYLEAYLFKFSRRPTSRRYSDGVTFKGSVEYWWCIA